MVLLKTAGGGAFGAAFVGGGAAEGRFAPGGGAFVGLGGGACVELEAEEAGGEDGLAFGGAL